MDDHRGAQPAGTDRPRIAVTARALDVMAPGLVTTVMQRGT